MLQHSLHLFIGDEFHLPSEKVKYRLSLHSDSISQHNHLYCVNEEDNNFVFRKVNKIYVDNINENDAQIVGSEAIVVEIGKIGRQTIMNDIQDPGGFI